MKTINILGFLALIYLASLLIRVFRKTNPIDYWKAVKSNFNIKVKRALAEQRGETPFYYEKGKVEIWAKTSIQADAKYKDIKKSLKANKNAKSK